MLDRKDSLLPPRRRRRETPHLTDEHVVESAETDLNGWKLTFQIVAQAAKCHPRSSRLLRRHLARTLPRDVRLAHPDEQRPR